MSTGVPKKSKKKSSSSTAALNKSNILETISHDDQLLVQYEELETETELTIKSLRFLFFYSL